MIYYSLLFQTWRGGWLCLLGSSKELTNVVLHGTAFSCVEEYLFLCEYLWWYIVHQLDVLLIILLADSCVPSVHFQTQRLWLYLLHFSRDVTHVVLYGAAFSCDQENLFLCKHLPWYLVHQLDALFIFLLAVVF
jgi:hypothetical protein